MRPYGATGPGGPGRETPYPAVAPGRGGGRERLLGTFVHNICYTFYTCANCVCCCWCWLLQDCCFCFRIRQEPTAAYPSPPPFPHSDPLLPPAGHWR